MEFLAYKWSNPAPVVVMMLRLVHPPFDAAEIALAWLKGASRIEWWMTKIGTFPDHYHRFRILDQNGDVLEERIQWGYAGNMEKHEDDTQYKNIRAALK